MGIFDLFKKGDKKSDVLNTDNGILGPTFLEGFTEHIDNPKDLHSHEWRRKLRTAKALRKIQNQILRSASRGL